MIASKCLFTLSVVLLGLLKFGSSEFIMGSTNQSNLSFDWNIKFTIFAKFSSGLVLYSTDGSNRLIVTLESESIIVAFNSNMSVLPLLEMCGCTQCKDFLINFEIYRSKGGILFDIECENIKHHYSLTSVKNYDKWDRYPMTTTRQDINQIFFWMANIGIHKNHKNETIYPLKDQLYGCVDNLLYNDNKISFSEGHNFLRTCSDMCVPRVCNNGTCLKRISNMAQCDCAKTFRNGQYCNKSLMDYIDTHNKSFRVHWNGTHINMKLSWKHNGSREYSLLELRNDNSSVVLIHVKNSKFTIDEKQIQEIFADKEYFVNIKLTQKNVSIKFENKEQIKSIIDCELINIGFSKSGDYKSFAGQYDFHYDASQIIPHGEMGQKSTVSRQKGDSINSKTVALPLLSVIVFLGLILFILLNGIMIIWTRSLRRPGPENLNADAETDLYAIPSYVKDDSESYDSIDYMAENILHYGAIDDIYANDNNKNTSEINSPEPPSRIF